MHACRWSESIHWQWYPNAELALPENTAWLGDFGASVLNLSVGIGCAGGGRTGGAVCDTRAIGELTVHGTPVPIGGGAVTVALDAAAGAQLPPEVASVAVLGLNVFGRVADVNCSLAPRQLTCRATATPLLAAAGV